MPFVRCRFYTGSGEPVKGGCRRKGAGCAFVHPGDSDWISAPPPRNKSGDSGHFKPWGERDNRSTATPLTWDTGGNAGTSTADAGGGWDTRSGRGTGTGTVDAGSGWDTGSGWGTGGNAGTSTADAGGRWDTGSRWGTSGGWDTGGSTSTQNQVPETSQPRSPSTTKSRDVSTLVNEWGQAGATCAASGNTESNESGWGGAVDEPMGSAWGSNGSDGWGATTWGENKDTGDSTPNSGWGTGWGDNKDTTSAWGVSDSMIVDNQAEKETKQSRGRGKGVIAPPRIRIPENDYKKAKLTGTNNQPLGTSKWGESRSSNLLPTLTPVTASTPVATSTPTDSFHVKRKRDVALDDKSDAFKGYVKTWERGVRARFLLAEAEAKRDRWFRTQKSACYARIGEAGRKRLDGQRAECDKEVNSQRQKLSGAITSLVGFQDTISSNLDLGQHYNVGEEMKMFIVESKAFVDEVRALLVEHVLRDENKVRSDDTQKHPSNAELTSIDSLRSQVRDLEERFEQAQAELTLSHKRDVGSEIDELLIAKIAGLRVARQHEMDRVSSQPCPEIAIPPDTLKNIEETAQQVRDLDAKVPRTVESIRVLLLRVDATTKRVSELEEELAMNKETHRKQMQEMATEKEETEQKMDERLEKIREQYEQLVASQPCSPAAEPSVSPGLTTDNPQDKLMESLRPAFKATLDKFYEQEVRPTIASLHQDVIKASDRYQEEAIRVLWGKMQPAMNMVAGVSRWLDSQELRLTAPVDDL